jgi:hypothetical protein
MSCFVITEDLSAWANAHSGILEIQVSRTCGDTLKDLLRGNRGLAENFHVELSLTASPACHRIVS